MFPVSRTIDRFEATFDHDGLVANAGLIVVATSTRSPDVTHGSAPVSSPSPHLTVDRMPPLSVFI